MGRFYSTSQGNYLDFIYQQPKSLLLETVKVADSQIAEQEAKVADLHGRLKFNALTPDTGKRDEIINGYKSQIDNLAEEIRSRPLDFRKDTPAIRGLSDKIKDDMERGQIAAIESNYNTRKSYEEKLTAQVKAKTINPVEKEHLLNSYDAKFKEDLGTQYKATDKYNQYETGYLAPNVDMFKIIDERLTGMKPMLEEKFSWNLKDKGDGTYIVTSKKGDEVVSKERVDEAVKDILNHDAQISEALSTRMKEGVEGYDPTSVDNLLQSGVDYALNKFAYTKHTESGSAKTDGYRLAGYQDNLKNKYIPSSRNQDMVGYSNLYGGAADYTQANTNATTQNNLFTTQTTSIMGDVQKQLMSKMGLTINPDGVITSTNYNDRETITKHKANAYRSAANRIQQAFEVARKTGDFTAVNSMMKENGIKPTNNSVENFSKSWTPEVAIDLNNWDNKKANMRKAVAQKYGLTDPKAIEEKTAQVLNDPRYNTSNNTLFETQNVTEYNSVKNGQYVGWLDNTLGQNPVDFMTGKGGVFLLQGNQGQGGKPTSSSFNQLVKDNYLKFVQNGRKEVYVDEDGVKKEQVVGYIGGKEVRMTAHKVFHTYEDVPGLEEGYKYKQRFTFTDPKTGEVVEASMIQDENHLPLPKEYKDLKNKPQEVVVAQAGKILTLAEQENDNLVTDGLLKSDNAVTEVPQVKGLKVYSQGNGNHSYTYGNQAISQAQARELIKLKLSSKKIGK